MFPLPSPSQLRVLAATGLVAATSLIAFAAPPQTPANSAQTQAQATQNYGKLPLSFEANQGQSGPQVKFLSRGKGYSLFLTEEAAVLTLSKGTGFSPDPPRDKSRGAGRDGLQPIRNPEATTDTLQMQLAHANPNARVEGANQLPGIANYFLGNDPSKWQTNIPTYAQVRYTGVYDGIDLVYYGNQSQLEYDFIVAPHADPAPIQLHFEGAKKLTLTPAGDLQVTGQNGQIAFHKPILYQEQNGRRQPIQGQFQLAANHTVRFQIGPYDHNKQLTIDPVLSYSTYLGGTNSGDHGDAAWAIAVDASGSAYVVGQAYSTNFPTLSTSYEPKDGAAAIGVSNAFVTKLNSTGTALVYSTYLGGTSDNANDIAFGIAIDASGDAYVVGQATSTDFPTTKNAYQSAIKARENAFLSKLNPTGNALIYSTCLGGTYQDLAYAVAVDASGDAYVTGQTQSKDFPYTPNAFQTVNKNPFVGNAFVTKFNPSGTGLLYSTYLGGANGHTGDIGAAIAIDAAGDAYVAGQTRSLTFPVTSNAYQTVLTGQLGAFITKLDPKGAKQLYSTYLAGSYADGATAIAVDSANNAYVAGFAGSNDFPTTTGVFQPNYAFTASDGTNAFIAKLNPEGSQRVYATYLGGNGEGDSANAIAIDGSGDVYVTGDTAATNFPLTSGAYQTANNAYRSSAFVTKLNPTGSGLLYSTYLGGSGSPGNGGDSGNGIALNPATGDAFAAGRAYSPDFPTTPTAYQPKNKGAATGTSNAFISKLAIGGETTTTIGSNSDPAPQGANVTFTAKVLADYGAAIPTGSVTFTIDGTPAATVPLASGQASYSTAMLALGSHTVLANYSGSSEYLASSIPFTETIRVATPILSPAAGQYTTSPLTVTISDATPGAAIYYTLTPGSKGTTPTSASTLYAGPISVSSASVIEAIAVLSPYQNSLAASAPYTFETVTVAPNIAPNPGSYTEAQLVTIANSSKNPTAPIYYTLNGTTPTSASAKYTAPFLAAANETVSAIAIAPGDAASSPVSAAYTFTGAPTLLAGPATSVTASSATLNAFVSTQGLPGTYYFQYGASSTALTSTTPKTALTTLPSVQASANLTGLKTRTPYYFQFVVSTAAGTVSGPVLTFTAN